MKNNILEYDQESVEQLQQSHINQSQNMNHKKSEVNNKIAINYKQSISQQSLQKYTLLDQNIMEQEQDYSIFNNPNIKSSIAKYSIPILLTFVFSLFLYSNLTKIGILGAKFNVGIFQSQVYTLKSFSMFETVKEQWQAGVYPLAIMVMLFSGLWPFLKISMLLSAWFINTKYLSYKNRERFLIVLDALGKWSFFDCIIMILLIDGLSMEIKLKTKEANLKLDVMMLPYSGYYAFLISTLFSLTLTHLELYFHRKTISDYRINQFLKFQEQQISNGIVCKKGMMLLSKKRRIINISLLVTCLGLMIGGIFIQSVSFDIEGLAGILVGPQAHQSYSIWELGSRIPQNTTNQTATATFFIQAYFMGTNVFIPILFLIMLLVLFIWAEKMTLKNQLILFSWIEIVYAWSTIDVVVVALAMAIVEMKQFIKFLIADHCDTINIILKKAEELGLIEIPGNPVCFDAVTRLEVGCLLLFFSAIMFILLGTYILRSLQNGIDTKLQMENEMENRKSSHILDDKKSLQKNLEKLAQENPQILNEDASLPLLL